MLLLGPRVRDGVIGYHVVVPLVRPDGSTVLVDRGFVKKELAPYAKQNLAADTGEVEVLGMLRTAEVRNNFTPENHPDKGEWYWADVEAMAVHAGGDEAGVQPVLIEQVFGEHSNWLVSNRSQQSAEGHAGDAALHLARGIPIGRSPTVDVRNSHVSYIVTWYANSSVLSLPQLMNRSQQVLAVCVYDCHVLASATKATTDDGSYSSVESTTTIQLFSPLRSVCVLHRNDLTETTMVGRSTLHLAGHYNYKAPVTILITEHCTYLRGRT